MYLPYTQMPEHSRAWVYQSDRVLTEQEEKDVRLRMVRFCESWNTHGQEMPTSFDILDSRILVLLVDESRLSASGCSIDSSVRVLRELEESLGINLTDQGKISLKNTEGTVKIISALGVKSKILSGEIQEDMEAINPSISTKADLQSLWQPVRNSWLGKYFPN